MRFNGLMEEIGTMVEKEPQLATEFFKRLSVGSSSSSSGQSESVPKKTQPKKMGMGFAVSAEMLQGFKFRKTGKDLKDDVPPPVPPPPPSLKRRSGSRRHSRRH